MNKIIATLLGITVAAAAITVNSALYTVSETEQVVTRKFGNPNTMILGDNAGEVDSTRYNSIVEWNEKQKLAGEASVNKITVGAGLKWKTPFIESVTRFDDRILEYDSAPSDIVTKDKKNLLINNYARWKINNPLLFMQRVQTENGAQPKLDDIIYSVIREHTGRNNLIEIVRTSNNPIETTEQRHVEYIEQGRELIMEEITYTANQMASEFGMEILDVRIKRADLPKQNETSVYGRMTKERQKEAKQYRSEGEEQARVIRAETDRDKDIILSEAYMKAEQIRGEGEAEALNIYAKSYNQDRDFYEFWRTLESYKTDAVKEGTKVVMSSDSDYFQFLKGPAGN
ncbi:MAG: protease modulator HflC [archaeon]